MATWLLLGLVGAQVPLWVTFDVANPSTVGGHRVLHLEDVVGPDQRRDIPGLPIATAVLVFSVRAEDCAAQGFCAAIAEWSAKLRGAGVLVVAVVPTERDRADALRARMATVPHPFAVSVDPYGVVSTLVGLERPGTFVLIDGKGRSRRWTPGAGRATLSARSLAQIRDALEPRSREKVDR